MSKSKKGLRIGNYRITPLGIATLVAIILLIAAFVALIIIKPFEGDGIFATPTPTPTVAPTPTPSPTPTPTPSPTPQPTPRAATIRSLGEIAIQKNLLASASDGNGGYDFSEMFTYISDVAGDADYTVANVEGSLGGTASVSSSELMITPSSLIEALKGIGVDMLNMANDHALDGGMNDLMSGLEKIKAAGMDYVGAAASPEEKAVPKIVDINGIRVGFVSYTETLNGMEQKAGVDSVKYGVNMIKYSNAASDIQALRGAGAEVVVAYVSWGEMLNRNITAGQQAIAKALVAAGTDVIIGYNPHVIQPASWIEMKDGAGNVTKRTLCMSATGNFLSDSRDKSSDCGVIFEFTIQERADYTGLDITSPVYIPTYVWRIDKEEGGFDYRTLPVGQWLETAPEGMNYTQSSRLKEVWAEAQSVMGPNVATVSNG